MKLSFIALTFSFAIFFPAYGQVKEAAQNAKVEAQKMSSAFINGDYKTFASYTYPVLLKSVGGADKMAEVLTKTVNDMQAKGMRFLSISFDEPTKIVKSGNELQCTIAQHTTISLNRGRIVSTSTLIAISIDNGQTWKFIDTSNKDMVTLRKALPNLSPKIAIPPQQPPLRYNY